MYTKYYYYYEASELGSGTVSHLHWFNRASQNPIHHILHENFLLRTRLIMYYQR